MRQLVIRHILLEVYMHAHAHKEVMHQQGCLQQGNKAQASLFPGRSLP